MRQKAKETSLKEIQKKRQLQKKRIAESKNIFMPKATADYSAYKPLYSRPIQEDIEEYELSAYEGDKKNTARENLSKLKENTRKEDEELKEETPEVLEGATEEVHYGEIVRGIYDEKSQKPVNKIQNALFMDKHVVGVRADIKTGQDAISFFAKYGNTTPIKFIDCSVQDDQKVFRPYDLKVIRYREKDSDQKEHLKEKYYTISANGIVKVHTEEYKRSHSAEEDISTEVISLSDWMHESTLFNIITNIDFFKSYENTKLYIIWKNYVRYQIFLKTRLALSKDCFIAKPAFAQHLMNLNHYFHDFHNHKTISNNLAQTKSWDVEEFKTDQKNTRTVAFKQHEKLAESIFQEVKSACDEVNKKTLPKESEEGEDLRYDEQIKQRPMNEISHEKKENAYLLKIAHKDKIRLKNFMRLVDYLTVETLVQVNYSSMQTLLQEMKRERKTGLFNIAIHEESMTFSPNEPDMRELLENLLRDMVEAVRSVPRVLSKIEEFRDMLKWGEMEFKESGNIDKIITVSVDYKRLHSEMMEKVKYDYQMIQNYIDENYDRCKQILAFMGTFQPPEWDKEEVLFEEIRSKIKMFGDWNNDIKSRIKDITKGILNLTGSKIANKITVYLDGKLGLYKTQLERLMKSKILETKEKVQKYSQALEAKHMTYLDEYTSYIIEYNTVVSDNKKLEAQKNEIETMQTHLKRFEGSSKENDNNIEMIKSLYNKLQTDIEFADGMIKQRYAEFKEKHDLEASNIKLNIELSLKKLFSEKLTDDTTQIPDALAEIQQNTKSIEKVRNRNERIMRAKANMGIPIEPNRELADLEAKFNDRKLLWFDIESFRNKEEEWKKANLLALNSADILRDMQKFETTIAQLKIRITNLTKEDSDKVLNAHEARILKFKSLQPIIVALANKDLSSTHWTEIYKVLDAPIAAMKPISLIELMDYKVIEHIERIEEISARATGEAIIWQQVEEIKKKWTELCFIVNNYRDYKEKFVLGSVEEILQALDDHQLKIQSMMGSRYISGVRPQVEEWEKKLLLFSEIIDEWLSCQRQWMYLENIFNAEDIQKQLPQETTKFMQVDKFWRDIMAKTHKRPLVQDTCSNEELLKKFQRNNKELEDIQRCLQNYLETKRSAFPRFYFLSNDELLEILSQTRNPHAVQAHLRKCFDNINRIEFTDVEDSREIVAMQSAEPETMPEKVQFSVSVMSEGPVEHWLMRIQEMMIKSLYDRAKQALHEYPDDRPLDRKAWLFAYPSQLVLLVDLIKWTTSVTDAITAQESGDPRGVEKFYEFMKVMIDKMVAIVREDLNTLQRTLMGALIVLDVHARDVVHELVAKQVSNLNDFEWSKQLRYYWEADVDNCVARQTNTRFIYGYEYLGNGPRLVITPLTDKCYMTLTGAKHLQYGGAPAGPAGTGKTETTKDLAKALAIQCVVFNCSDGLDYKTMGRFFSGLAQGGAWACFDEFNRIDIEVLSVIAQQILTIQQAIKRGEEEFQFEGRLINLNSRFGVFITMNPGYAGRTELPDNLKALFRPVAMMIPDYALIAEIILFSEGFSTARVLARKMVQLYKLSSEQLSKQDHYDFGMRAVKSVLVMAGALRRKESKLSEEVVLIRAMRDSNIPKFLEHDLPLFMGIISDLFPSVDIPNVDYGLLQKAIDNQLELKHYMKPKGFITKITQLMETIMVRHGVMVVGLTGTGKTTVISTLSRSLAQLNSDGSRDYYHKQVKEERLNPKSVSMNELFGYTNVLTNEWTDGIVAEIVRNNVADTSDSKKWIIFDGPVDALWIENMNTVLDDNKMLCLSNGQRIKLPATFTMMFEVNDLAVASPATVSRCGMVYMEPLHLGWEPLVDTWAHSFKEANKRENSKEPYPSYVILLIDKLKMFFKENLPFLREECKEMIPTQDTNLVSSAIDMIEILYNELPLLHNIFLDKLTTQEAEAICSMILIFSFVWSAGGNLHDNPRDNSRNKFSQNIRAKIRKFFMAYPYEIEVFDCFIDFQKKELRPWSDLITDFKYRSDIPYFNILVPTADTVKFKYILNKLIAGKKNCLISGQTGVGKSVVISDFVHSLPGDVYTFTLLNFSAQTSTKNLLDVFMDKDKFVKKRRYEIRPANNKKMVLFVDDINMPALEKYGAQPPNELLRQIIDQKGFYDLKKFNFIEVSDCIFVAACAPPGGGRNPVSPRLFRHFHMIWNPDLSIKSMETIFIAILKGFLMESNSKGLQKLTTYIVKSSVQIYTKIRNELLPTPTKSHYTFNLRDLSKVFQGILQIRGESLANKEQLVALWAHESQRVFHDRLVDDRDREWFLTLIQSFINSFQFQWSNQDLRDIIFGDYANTTGEYMQIVEIEGLSRKFNDYLVSYNAQNPSKTMNLVFFKDAIMHLSRICRVLKQNRGNLLLIGVGGSGRQSLTRLAASLRECKTLSIEITKNYKDPQWKDDLKNLLKNAGKGDKTTFLFSDTQIVKESFLEDLNNILNTGEVPNIWAVEDYQEILNEMRPIAKQRNLFQSREQLMKLFIQLTRENLHIVLAFSPVGEKLRNRCRQFPSIINCCTIDWFDRWPQEALYSVAEKEYKAKEELGISNFIQKLSEMSVAIHKSMIDYSERFWNELRRKNYVTPTSYLELVKLYLDMMKAQQNKLPLQIRKYTIGLQTLKETNEVVSTLQKKIREFQPILEQSSKEKAELMVILERENAIEKEKLEICSKDTAEAEIKKNEVNNLKNICQADLDRALPIQRSSERAVAKVDKNGLGVIKSFKSPADKIVFVCNAVCLIFGEAENWDTFKRKILPNMGLQQDMANFKAGNLDEKTIAKLRKNYVDLNLYTDEDIATASAAAEGMWGWVKALNALYEVEKEIAPKKKKLEEAEKQLEKVNNELNIKKKDLKAIEDNKAILQKKFDTIVRESDQLSRQKDLAAVQLIRAEKLVGGLANQAERWKVNVAQLSEDITNLTGNILLASASIAYVGPFTADFRQEMINSWKQLCKDKEIPVSDDYQLSRILATEVEVREWQEKGLPSDSLSIDNGIFMFNSRRWPLIIDPQGQANKWIKNVGKDVNIQVTKLTEHNFIKILENAIRNGQSVLMENVEEELDPSLEPILNKQIVKSAAGWVLRLGDSDIPYGKEFKFYMTTKMPNPHYIPEICIKTTIINFTVTPLGLEDQLLAEVVRFERIELETRRVELILQISQDKKQLQDLEDKILRLIGEAQGRILEDQALINTLDASKVTSQAVNTRIAQSRTTSVEIDRARQEYRMIARRGSVIYFVISDLANIDPMYQYSLEYFIKLFKKRLEVTPKKDVLLERINLLIDDVTESFYINICRGLFEKDKLLYSFLIAIKIQLSAGKVNPKQWVFFLRGPDNDPEIEGKPAFLPDRVFIEIVALSNLSPSFRTVADELKNQANRSIWEAVMESENPIEEKLPQTLDSRLDYFQKILFMKVLRPEKLIGMIKYYVRNTVGQAFIESPVFDLKGSYTDSSSTTPIIFVLSPGADPISYLISLAKDCQMDTRLKMLSLGQGQGDIAKELIKAGRRNGDWVCLQNCHLAISWMTELERIQENQVAADTHGDFRLWLTSMPTNRFPVPVLQSGIKLTNEPPKGLKANLTRTYNQISETMYNSCQKQQQFKKLLFSLAFFHACILERRKYGAIGWNISYEWMNSDFETCLLQLKMYLDEQPIIPYQTLKYLIAEINYGGRVTDDKDSRLINALLNKYFTPKLMEGNFNFEPKGIYHSPVNTALAEVKSYIVGLPLDDDPEVYGLHPNANITFQQKNVREFIDTLLLVQPRSNSGGAGSSADQIGERIAKQIEGRIPDPIPVKKMDNPISLDIFKMQEVDRFNILLRAIKKSLVDLQKAIKGTVVMSIQLEDMFNSFLIKKVPQNWEKYAYPSLKPLHSWVNDLIERITFYKKWVEMGYCTSYWVSSFFFPQGFMTASLQTYARKTQIPIDTLVFRSHMMPFHASSVLKVPDSGVNIHGLFAEGCRCDIKTGQLEESHRKELYFELPVIWLEPITVDKETKSDKIYKCPVYKTSTRKGTLSTTGHSTNFVMYLDFGSSFEPDHWVRRGVAFLCQLDQ